MNTHEDSLKSFIPKSEINFVILGTMVAMNGRTINGEKPEDEFFYYNNNRNHFWRVLQYLMNSTLENNQAIKKLTIKEKKEILEENGIAIINLIQKIEVSNKNKFDPSDTVIFEAYKKDKIKYKKIPPKIKKVLISKPKFFTCRSKKGIDQLLNGFIEINGLPKNFKEDIWYWATPTRCNPYQRSLQWKNEMKNYLKGRK